MGSLILNPQPFHAISMNDATAATATLPPFILHHVTMVEPSVTVCTNICAMMPKDQPQAGKMSIGPSEND